MKQFYHFFTILFFTLALQTAVAQAPLTPDQFNVRLSEAKNDSDKVKIYLLQVKALADTKVKGNVKDAIKLNLKAIALAERINYLAGLTKCYAYAVAFAKFEKSKKDEKFYQDKLNEANALYDIYQSRKIKALEEDTRRVEDSLAAVGKELDIRLREVSKLNKENKTSLDKITFQAKVISSKDTVINRQKLEKERADALLKATEQEKTIAELRATEQKQTTRLVTAIGVAILAFLMIALYGFWRNRKLLVQVAAEKERADKLLTNILPDSVAAELKQRGAVKAQRFDDATVVFTDFVGFTKVAEGLSPELLVAEIDMCYRAFDEIVTRHGLEKIKTIGDAYLFCGGLPKPKVDHHTAAIAAALELAHWVADYSTRREAANQPHFSIRIGAHCGSLVSGLVCPQ